MELFTQGGGGSNSPNTPGEPARNGDSNMLVLSRKIQESVVVGSSDGFERLLKVTVLEIAGRKVRLGFDVDSAVPVHRLEVWEKIQAGGPKTLEAELTI
jgi:carbon storage regulator